jgi:hypothetical protein
MPKWTEGPWDTPTNKCPYCGTECEADWVDVGVGKVQCGPYYCENCKASSIGAYDDTTRATPEENKIGWYGPGKPVSDKANTCLGIPVDHKTAKKLYEAGLLDEKAEGI